VEPDVELAGFDGRDIQQIVHDIEHRMAGVADRLHEIELIRGKRTDGAIVQKFRQPAN